MVNALELSAGKLIKIPQHASSEDYSSSLSQRDATGVVAVLLGIVATHRGVQHAPLAMLGAHTKVLTVHTTASIGCHEVQDRHLPAASTVSNCTCPWNMLHLIGCTSLCALHQVDLLTGMLSA